MEAEIEISGCENLYTVAGRIIKLSPERDALLTEFGKQTLKDRYLWKGEDFQKMFARVAAVNSDDHAHAQRMYDYISQLWFMPATPVLSNSGHEKNLPISCFLNAVGDSLEEISETFTENFWLATRGGGIGTYWGEIRDIGEPVADRGKTSGVIPFVRIQDSQTLGLSQGSLRRGSAAAYLDVSHPEIGEFLGIRRGEGDENRQCNNIHHGVIITDAFMQAVREGANWHLVSPHTGKVKEVVKARDLWQKILITRVETGEPYLWFVDNVNNARPAVYRQNGLKSLQSNLCSEISLTTAVDYNGKRRTAVCCLSSLNLEKWDEWHNNDQIVEDCLRFLDNVMQSFIDKTDGIVGFERANYAARQERSVGLGVMGFHGFLQSKGVPFEGVIAKSWNMRMFNRIKSQADAANMKLALERGSCPDAERVGILARFAHMLAIAPTASISIIAGESSPGIEPNMANAYVQKTLSGRFLVKNKYLDKLLRGKASVENLGTILYEQWLDEQWNSIIEKDGSVQHLDYLSEDEKMLFRTAFEMNQRWIVEHAADRQPMICQGQSVNLFISATINKKELLQLHMLAWEKGLKGLYYCRSMSTGKVTKVSHTAGEMPQAKPVANDGFTGGDECLSCQ